MRRVVSGIAVLTAPLCLVSCGETRHETPEFFEEKTGLPLCSDAELTNRTVGDHDFEVDFTYSVDLELSARCENMLLAEIKNRLGIECESADNCSFMDSNNWSYELRRLNDGKLNFTLRAI